MLRKSLVEIGLWFQALSQIISQKGEEEEREKRGGEEEEKGEEGEEKENGRRRKRTGEGEKRGGKMRKSLKRRGKGP